MNEEQRCPICGLRPATHLNTQTLEQPWGTLTVHFFSNGSTESLCFGHHEAHFTGTMEDLKKHCAVLPILGTPVLEDDTLPNPHYVFCPRCRYHIHIEVVHTDTDCEELQRGTIPQPERIAVPNDIQNAFRDEELEL